MVLLLSIKSHASETLVKSSILIISLFFAFINILKTPESDLYNYIEYYNYLTTMSISDVLNFRYLNVRDSEVVFKVYVWLLAQLSNSASLFVFMSTLIMYYLVTLFSISISNLFINKEVSKNNVMLMMMIVWCCFVGITFSLTGHVIRQYLSMAIFVLGIQFLFNRRFLAGVIVVILSVLIHNSIVLFLVLLSFSVLFSKYITKVIFFLPGLVIAYFLSDYLVLFGGNFQIGNKLNAMSWIMPLIDSFLLALYVYSHWGCRRKKYIMRINAFLVLYILFLVLFHQELLISQRLYYFFDIVRSVIGVLLIQRFFYKYNDTFKSILVIPFIAVAVVYFLIKYSFSPWDYGPDYSHVILIDYSYILTRLNV